MNPLVHYLEHGAFEGRSANTSTQSWHAPSMLVGKHVGSDGFDPDYYLLNNADVAAVAATTADPAAFALKHYQTFGWHEGRNPNAWFDVKGYLSHYPDIAAMHVDPLQQYVQLGAKQGRDPSGNFDTFEYLVNNPDVAAANVNPLVHYLQHGVFEGRAAVDSSRAWHDPSTLLAVGSSTSLSITSTGEASEARIPLLAGHRYTLSVTDSNAITGSGVVDVNFKGIYGFDGVHDHVYVASSYKSIYAKPSLSFTDFVTGINVIDFSRLAGGSWSGGPFDLVISDVTSAPAQKIYSESAAPGGDFGNQLSSAFDIGSGATGTHAFEVAGNLIQNDHDVFKFSTKGGNLDFRVSGTSGGQNFYGFADGVDFAIFDSNGSPVHSIIGGINNGAPDVVHLDPGTYYLDLHTDHSTPTHYLLDVYM